MYSIKNGRKERKRKTDKKCIKFVIENTGDWLTKEIVIGRKWV